MLINFYCGNKTTIVKLQRGITPRKYIVTLLVACTSSNDALYFCKVSQNMSWKAFYLFKATKLHCQIISKENYSKNIKIRVIVLVVCMLSDDVLYFYEAS